MIESYEIPEKIKNQYALITAKKIKAQAPIYRLATVHPPCFFRMHESIDCGNFINMGIFERDIGVCYNGRAPSSYSCF